MRSGVVSLRCSILLCIFFCLLVDVDAIPHCNNRNHEVPENCVHGLTKDYCNRDVCAKGPGERCGGSRLQLGSCGGGMYCGGCGLCIGCSAHTLKCHSGEFC